MSPTSDPLLDRFRGCLLGLAVGDALGAPYEALTDQDIFHRFGLPEAFIRNPSGDPLRYTDDTEMTIGVAESLIEHGEICGDELMRTFAANFHVERRYGRGASRLLETAREGGDWKTLAETIMPGGSFGNGGAMRAAPVGLLFHRDPDRVWKEAGKSAKPTHRHPIGIEGARVMALAVSMAVTAEAIDRKAFLAALLERAKTEEFRWALKAAAKLRRGDSLAGLGSTVHAHRSVVTAVACFLSMPDDYEYAVGRAIGLGDDTDTLAAMTGALVGAFAGLKAVPVDRLAELENGEKGRDYIDGLARKLFEIGARRDFTAEST